MLFGPPKEIKAVAHLGETGVDEQAAVVLLHEGGRIAVSHTAIRTTTWHNATIFGTEGCIRIDKHCGVRPD